MLKCETCKEEIVVQGVRGCLSGWFDARKNIVEVIMYLLYFFIWVIFNGNFTLEIALIGFVIAGVLLAFTCKFMDYSIANEFWVYKKAFFFLKYICLLVKEIVKANFSVIHMILTQREEVEPVLVSFHSDLKTAVGKAFLANCITLTPGTITVSLEGSKYTVHCLDETMAEGIHESEFIEFIRQLEENTKLQKSSKG